MKNMSKIILFYLMAVSVFVNAGNREERQRQKRGCCIRVCDAFRSVYRTLNPVQEPIVERYIYRSELPRKPFHDCNPGGRCICR